MGSLGRAMEVQDEFLWHPLPAPAVYFWGMSAAVPRARSQTEQGRLTEVPTLTS